MNGCSKNVIDPKLQRATRRLVTIVRKPGRHNGQRGLMHIAGRTYECALGKNGVTSFKREGDGCTPRGQMAVLFGYARFDRLKRSQLPTPCLNPIRGCDLWCDDQHSPNYNQPVTAPFKASHEELTRGDALYDLIVVLDWNMSSCVRGRGSAIFWHVAPDHDRGTLGCIALKRSDFLKLKGLFSRPMIVRVL